MKEQQQDRLARLIVRIVVLPFALICALPLWLFIGLFSMGSLGKVLINTGLNWYNPNNWDKLK